MRVGELLDLPGLKCRAASHLVVLGGHIVDRAPKNIPKTVGAGWTHNNGQPPHKCDPHVLVTPHMRGARQKEAGVVLSLQEESRRSVEHTQAGLWILLSHGPLSEGLVCFGQAPSVYECICVCACVCSSTCACMHPCECLSLSGLGGQLWCPGEPMTQALSWESGPCPITKQPWSLRLLL